MTTKGKPGRVVRIDDDIWAEYGELCAAEGASRAEDMRRHVYARVNAWRKAQGKAPRRYARAVAKPATES